MGSTPRGSDGKRGRDGIWLQNRNDGKYAKVEGDPRDRRKRNEDRMQDRERGSGSGNFGDVKDRPRHSWQSSKSRNDEDRRYVREQREYRTYHNNNSNHRDGYRNVDRDRPRDRIERVGFSQYDEGDDRDS